MRSDAAGWGRCALGPCRFASVGNNDAMLRSAVGGAALALLAVLATSAPARADDMCRVVDVELTPAPRLQIAVWLETAAGAYVDTLYLTQLTGTYGLGNRPGLKDFNSAWHWPYGRREFALPIWAHRTGKSFPKVVFQNQDDTNLSHPLSESSDEPYYCRPLQQGETQWDTETCSSRVFTDKGMLSATETSVYPPRADLMMKPDFDDPAVATYKELDPFDAVSEATPIGGMDFTTSWPIPSALPAGDYVVWVEASQESDFNGTYNATTFPPPTRTDGTPLPWSNYGLPARGQPSVVYQVPITISTDQTIATTSAYAGYGDPEGVDGTLHAPDATITTDTPGSGAARLQLTADGSGGTFRVRVAARPEFDSIRPGPASNGQVLTVDERSATVSFVEPGDDGLIGKVMGYELRYRAGDPITDANFLKSSPVMATVDPVGPGTVQTIDVGGLLPQTDYYIGVRAFDECKNLGDLLVIHATTTPRQPGYVDACFVATAAYGSLMANDVELLRRFRDQYLQSNVLGELAVETYYSVGPAVAGVVGQSDGLRGVARAALAPLIERVRGLHGR
jgi:hypothetical protein